MTISMYARIIRWKVPQFLQYIVLFIGHVQSRIFIVPNRDAYIQSDGGRSLLGQEQCPSACGRPIGRCSREILWRIRVRMRIVLDMVFNVFPCHLPLLQHQEIPIFRNSRADPDLDACNMVIWQLTYSIN